MQIPVRSRVSRWPEASGTAAKAGRVVAAPIAEDERGLVRSTGIATGTSLIAAATVAGDSGRCSAGSAGATEQAQLGPHAHPSPQQQDGASAGRSVATRFAAIPTHRFAAIAKMASQPARRERREGPITTLV